MSLLRRGLSWLGVEVAVSLLAACALEGLSRAVSLGREGSFSASTGLTMLGFALLFAVASVLVQWPVRLLLRRAGVARVFALLLVFGASAFALIRPARVASSGAWARQQTWAPLLERGLPYAGALVIVLLTLLFLSRTPEGVVARVLRRVLAIAGFSAACASNVLLFAGQYRELHLGLLALSALFAVWMLEDARAPLAAFFTRGSLASWAALILSFGGAVALLALAVRPSETAASALLLGSQRAGYVIPYLARARKSDAIHERLMRFDARPANVRDRKAHEKFALPSDMNVLLVVVDTLRADTLPPTREQYHNVHFKPSDTPFLSELVGRSYRFSRAYGAGTMTRISMPSLFRSREAFEDNTNGGEPVAVAMSGLGRYPVAVVGQHFIEPTDERMAGLLEGFAEIEVYPESQQQEQNVLTRTLLERIKDRPFFAWLHYYAPHYKGFAGKPLEGPARAWPENYPKTVRWLDGQIRELFAMLKDLQIAERTLVVFTSDHGEGLMDTGQMWHGDSVLEEAVRVPLFFYVPGKRGALIQQTVGNIDIVPTLVDLLGGPLKASFRGASLVDLMIDPRAPWGRSYYIEAESDQRSAMVSGAQKQIFDHATKLHMHFDLDADPREDHNVFDATKDSHRRVLFEVVSRRPSLFRDGLLEDKTVALLDRKLSAIDVAAPPSDIGFLLDLIREKPDEKRLAFAARLFENAPSDAVRALVIERLYDVLPLRFQALLSERFQKLMPSEVEQYVAALADVDLPPAALARLSLELPKAAEAPRASLRQWLTLVSKMSLRREEDVGTLRRWLERLVDEPMPRDAVSLRLALTAVARLSAVPEREKPALTVLSLRLLDDPRANVEAAACRALGKLGAELAISPLRARLYHKPFVVRLGAMHGLAALIQGQIEPDLLRIGREPGYTLNAVVLLEKYGTPKANSFLTWVASHGERPFTRARANAAKKRIRERANAQPTSEN